MGSNEKSKRKKQEKIKRQFSAGGVVFKPPKSKESKKTPYWLIAKSSASKLFPNSVWRLPKGWIDNEKEDIPGVITRGEKKASEAQLRKAATREVEEEGGIKAKIITKIGTEKYFVKIKDTKFLKFVTFYLMEWINDLPEGFDFETEEVVWLPFNKARKKLSYSGEKKVLDKAMKLFSKEVG